MTPATPARVPWRHSLLTRLLVTAIVIATLAVAATAWLATRTATQAIRSEQGRSLENETGLYDALVGYAAQHPDWTGVGSLITEEAGRLGRRVTLTDTKGVILADSGSGPSPVNSHPYATVDPLRLDPSLAGGNASIDPRVVGPYRLTARERATALTMAHKVASCLAETGSPGVITMAASGRPVVQPPTGSDPKGAMAQCSAAYTNLTLPTERRALHVLEGLTADCLGGPGQDSVNVTVNWNTLPPTFAALNGSSTVKARNRVLTCLEQAHLSQLEPYTAPAALLFITDPDSGRTRPVFELSRANAVRIAGVTAAVLLVTILITALLGRRLVRPLRVLAEAAGGPTRAPISGRDEIGHLAAALDEANRRRDRAEAQRRAMVGDVAHELRNPLTNIRSWLEALQDGLAVADPNLIGLLHTETLVLQRILDDLSDLAAADAGTLTLHPGPVDLRDCLTQVVDAHVSAAATAGVVLSDQVPQAVTVRADPVRLRQLLGNLVSNGIRYTPRGGRVTVIGTQTGATVTIEVRDTGVGISQENLPKVFDRFWRADESRTRATGGSGLGLAIVRQLVSAHGGTVAVTSRLGQGTTFVVRLPAGSADQGPG